MVTYHHKVFFFSLYFLKSEVTTHYFNFFLRQNLGRALVSMWYSMSSKKLIVTIVRLEGIKSPVRGLNLAGMVILLTLVFVTPTPAKVDETTFNGAGGEKVSTFAENFNTYLAENSICLPQNACITDGLFKTFLSSRTSTKRYAY